MRVSALLLFSVPFGSSVVWAINSVDATRIVDDYESLAGLGDLPEGLQSRLEAAVMEAARMSVVNYDALIDEGVVNPEVGIEEVVTRMRERLAEQERLWDAIAPEWRAAFEQIRDRFRLCLEEEDSECLNKFRLMLQYEHALRMESFFQEREGQGREDGEQEFLMQMERSRERIETMLRNGDSATLNRLQVANQELERLRTRLQEQVEEQSGQPEGSASTTSTPGKGQP